MRKYHSTAATKLLFSLSLTQQFRKKKAKRITVLCFPLYFIIPYLQATENFVKTEHASACIHVAGKIPTH